MQNKRLSTIIALKLMLTMIVKYQSKATNPKNQYQLAGEQSGGGDGDGFRAKYKKHMEKKHSKNKDDSDSDSDSDLDSYVEPVFFIYDPFYYGNYLYSSYILNRSVLLEISFIILGFGTGK